MKILKTIIFSLFALMFINAGLDKFLHYMPVPDMPEFKAINEAMATLKWIVPLTGAVELTSGLLILFPKTRALGAIMIFPVMIGILVHNATFVPSGLLIAGVLFLILIWMLVDNKDKLKSLVS